MHRRKTACAILAVLMACSAIGCSANSNSETEAETEALETEAAETEETQPATETPELEGYNLLWSDEFDGTELNTDIWNYEPHEPGWTNNELQEYTTSEDNVFLRDGNLVIKAIESEVEGQTYYTSGKVTSQHNEFFTYGRVEVRAKTPEGQGLWPAIWMMPEDESYYGTWPKCGEIDIMEVLGNDTTTSYSTVHYGEPHSQQQGTITLDDGSFSDSFHTYAVEWEPGEMRFYTDDVLVLTVNDWFTATGGVTVDYPAPFNQDFFVQMNLAVGGDWPGDPDETTDFDNAEFEIDYVRVYQRDSYDTNVTRPERIFREALEDGNLIYNGDFSDNEDLTDDENWTFLLFNEGVGEASIEDNSIVISSENDGTEEYSVQLVQPDLPMYQGHTYRITFDIKADEERDCVVCVSAPTAGWIRYFPDTAFDVGTDWQTMEYEFTVTDPDDNNGRLEFNMGNHGYTSTLYISNVRVEDITE